MPELDRLVWVDIETTGFSPESNLVLELGICVTDLDLNIRDDFQVVIWDSPVYDSHWENQVALVVKEMHTKNLLIEECQRVGKEPDVAFDAACTFLEGQGVRHETEEPMCGSSIQFDRGFLDVQFPAITNRFSYRNIDISSVKELCRRYNPTLYSKLLKDCIPQKIHRVLPDIKDTIEEFRFYRDNFLYDSRPV